MKATFYLYLLAGFFSLYYSESIKVLESDNNRILIEYSPKILLSLDSLTNHYSVSVDSGISEYSEPGFPDIQINKLFLGLKSVNNNVISIKSISTDIKRGTIKPIPNTEKTEFSFTLKDTEPIEFNNLSNPIVNIASIDTSRGFIIGEIHLLPIQYNSDSREIKVVKKIIFELSYGEADTERFASNENYFSGFLLNWNQAVNWNIKNPNKNLGKLNSSPLNQGTWYKFETPNEGIYIINYSELSSFGINPSTVDPKTIKIYGFGGIIPENFWETYSNEMEEISVYVSGEADGVFNENDYIIFYGRNINFYNYSESDDKIKRFKNFFTEKNSYLITSGGTQGKRMEEIPSAASATYTQNSSKFYKYNDIDNFNLFKSGRVYLSDEFNSSTNSRTYINMLENIVPSTNVGYKIAFLNTSDYSVPISVSENSSLILNRYISPPNKNQYQLGRYEIYSASYNWNRPDNMSALQISFSASDPSDVGYLDYIELDYTGELFAVEDRLIYFSEPDKSSIYFKLNGFNNSNIFLFDITEHNNVKRITNPSISGGQANYSYITSGLGNEKFAAFCYSAFYKPENAVQITNSNLRDVSNRAEYIIITNEEFSSAAEKLKSFRETNSRNPLISKVVKLNEIYNEFSYGVSDPLAIRNFLKFALENWDVAPFYVLFFGDGTYDYLNRENYSNNFIPTFQTNDSFHDVNAYPSDDFYAYLEGNTISLVPGRITVNSIEQADLIVDKIINYETNSEEGIWRNKITLVADDSWTTEREDGSLHTSQSETLSNLYIPEYMDANKIYLAAYKTVSIGSGKRKPDVNKAIIDAINNGSLIVNFIGHGNPNTWTHEYVFERATTIPQLNNSELFFLTAATCDFGRYDDPAGQSSTEELLLMENSGIIGCFTASRAVYAIQNSELNNTFYNNLLKIRKPDGKFRTTGEGLYFTKQILSSSNAEKFHLFGDPAMLLLRPGEFAAVDSVNGESVLANYQIKALGSYSVSGSIRNSDGTLNNNYNGEAIISVFDSDREVRLEEINNYKVTFPGGVIYRGKSSVENGRFSATFRVPKDISYENKNGKIVAFVINENEDFVGYTRDIIVGGTDTSIVDDGNGPEINIYFDTKTLPMSYLVNPDFTLIIELSDQTGLNTTGLGVGHKLEAIINNDQENPIDLTNFYISDLNSEGKSGEVKYNFTSFLPGDYSLKIKAWDVFNNPSEQTVYFTVSDNNNLYIKDIYNYPNPFKDETHFTFQHNLLKAVDVEIKVYTIAGRLVKTIEEKNISDRFVKIHWDGRDNDFDLLSNGVYFYKIKIQSIDGEDKENHLGKLAIIR